MKEKSIINSLSLSGRLTGGLALFSLSVLGVLFFGVYFATKTNLEEKQSLHLKNTIIAINHLIESPKDHQTPISLLHDLEDLVHGDRDVHLKLIENAGRIHYISKSNAWPQGAQTIALTFPEERRIAQYSKAVVALDTSRDQALLGKFSAILLAAALIGCGTIALGGFVIVRQGLYPVRALAEQTRQLATLSLGERLDTQGSPDELVLLVDQFNELLNLLEKAYLQLESFNANVAHELRTPLAVMIANCELALRGSDSADQLREYIGSNLEDLQSLSGIISDMLFLSHADRGEKARRTPIANLSALCAEVVEYYEALFLDAGLNCIVEGDVSGSFDGALLRRAVSNLLNNATRHAEPGSTIQIRIKPDEKGGVSLSVSNRGTPISAESLPHIFDRFYRVDTSRMSSSQNHGLGLAIVSAIARMHDGDTNASCHDGTTTIEMHISLEA
jgi:two-component system, OmpR family, heavy metal sensor histidine kinase CusS